MFVPHSASELTECMSVLIVETLSSPLQMNVRAFHKLLLSVRGGELCVCASQRVDSSTPPLSFLLLFNVEVLRSFCQSPCEHSSLLLYNARDDGMHEGVNLLLGTIQPATAALSVGHSTFDS
jgi:hypothetical protein